MLAKRNFYKNCLPLIAENEKILDDREKLKVLRKKIYFRFRKQWLSKLLEYKVKKGVLNV